MFLSLLVLLSLAGSTLSLYRITEVDALLDAINRVSIPLGRLFSQMQADADVFRRELDHGLGYSHWKDPHWKPRGVPRWIVDVLQGEVDRAGELLRNDAEWATPEARVRWREWAGGIAQGLASLNIEAERLRAALESRNETLASEIYPRWTAALEDWRRQVQWGALEYERSSRQTFSLAEQRVSELRAGLELILVAVVLLSMMLLWLGERALRPLNELTRLAREITRRGLRKEDKAALPDFPLRRDDEVSSLAREFHRMATALLERERTVEAQKHRLEESNRGLRELADTKERLRQAENLAAVGRLSAQVAHEVRNPLHSIGLEAEMASELATRSGNPGLKQSLQSILASVDRLEKITENYLKLSKLSTGEQSRVDLGEVLETTLATYAPACESQGVRVDWKREPGSRLLVWADRDLLEQVLGNLFRNALQAIESAKPPARENWIRWAMGSAESGRVWIRIEDSGPGVSPQIREKLFTPFLTTRAQGTGLGLSFVKKVLDEHGGTIDLSESACAPGACFTLTLPPAPAANPEDFHHVESHPAR